MTTCGSCFRDEYGKIQECRKDTPCRACLVAEVGRLLLLQQNIYTLAQREFRKAGNCNWGHAVRLCEESGSKNSILRDAAAIPAGKDKSRAWGRSRWEAIQKHGASLRSTTGGG